MKTSYYFDFGAYGKRMRQTKVAPAARSIRELLPFLALLFGLLYGALLLRSNSTLVEQFVTIWQQTLDTRLDASFAAICLQSFLSNLCYLLLSTLLGFWAIGQPVLLLLLIAKGMSIGGLIGVLFLQYGPAGIGYAAVFVVPGAVFGILSLLFSVREAISLSGMLLQNLFGDGCELGQRVLRLYGTKQLVLLLFLLLAALLDGLTTMLAAQLFSL